MKPVRHLLALADEVRDDSACLPLAELMPRRGESIAAFIARSGWRVDMLPTVVRVGDLYYARAEWPATKIRANDNVLVISRPAQGGAGGGGNNGKMIGAAVAMIALAVLAPWAAGAVFGSGTLLASLAGTAVVAAGGLLISHFLKPKKAKTQEETPLYSFNLQGNQARPLQMIPILYGRRLFSPDLAAPPYSEYSGDDMTSYGLYALTCGRCAVEEIRIGDTTIWTRDDGGVGIGQAMEVEFYEPGEDVTLFPVNVVTSTDVTGTTLDHAISNDGMVGPFTVNPADTLASQIMVDLVWPSGCYVTYKDRVLPTSVGIHIEGRLIDAAGAAAGPWTTLSVKTYAFAKKSQIRVTERINVAPGRYEIRLGRDSEPIANQTLYDGKVNGQDDVVWSALRARIDGPQAFPGVTMMAIKATADAGLQSVNNGKIAVIATRILPVWNGSNWLEVETRSIAWAAIDAWANEQYSAGLPLQHVDLDTFAAYDDLWTDLDHSFDHVFTDSSSVVEAVETILKAGRAVPDIVGDTLTLMRDEDRGPPAMLFTDREIIRGSLSVNYVLYDSQIADGVVGQYLDESTWRLAEVSSAADGEVLAKPAKTEITGVTKRHQGAGLVRFQAAENSYRRTTIEFQVEAEGLLIKRGMPIAVQTEEPQVWGFAGEVLAYDDATRTLTLSREPPWDGSSSFWVEVRARDGAYFGPMRVAQGASPSLAIVNAADLASVSAGMGYGLAAAVTRSTDQELPSFVWSPGQPRAFRAIVREGAPSGDLLTITAVNDDPRVYDVVETGVPALPTIPPVVNMQVPGTITQLEARMQQEGTNAVLTVGWKPVEAAVRYLGRISYDGGATWIEVYRDSAFSFRQIVSPTDLLVQVCGINDRGVPGPFSQRTVAAIALVISSDNVNIVVDIDTLRPDLLDRTIVNPLQDAADLELAQFAAEISRQTQQIVVRSELNGLSTTVQQQMDTITDIAGATLGSWTVKITTQQTTGGAARKVVSGFGLVQEGGGGEVTSDFFVYADRFGVYPPFVDPDTPQPAPKPVFIVGTVDGEESVGINGDLYVDGSITAEKLAVEQLSAVTADLGTVTAGKLKSVDDKFQIDLANKRITISD